MLERNKVSKDTMMVDLCYRLVQLFGYRQDSLTIEFQ